VDECKPLPAVFDKSELARAHLLKHAHHGRRIVRAQVEIQIHLTAVHRISVDIGFRRFQHGSQAYNVVDGPAVKATHSSPPPGFKL